MGNGRWCVIRLLAGACLLTGPGAAAQTTPGSEPELVTDRPDVTESSVTVPHGRIQVEMGGTTEWTRDARQTTAPDLLARIGVSRWAELRAGLPSYSSGAEGGFGRAELGAKVASPVGGGWAAGVIAFVTLPTGTGALRGGSVGGGAVGTWSRSLTERLDLSGNTGAAWSGSGGGATWSQTLSLGIGLTERMGGFLEGYSEWEPGSAGQPHVDGGFTFLVVPAVQLDVSAGAGLGPARGRRFLGLGLSFRR